MPLPTRLLESYVLTGNREHLARCCEILDDWTLNSRKDIDALPIDIRSATELESERLRDFPGMMRVMVDERPELAKEFDLSTNAVREELNQLKSSGVISGGMVPKVQACIDAVVGGAASAHMLDGRVPHVLLLELFTDAGIGTMITTTGAAPAQEVR